MKKTILLLLLPCILMLCAFYSSNNPLVGHWVTTGNDKADVYFTPDSFRVNVNGAIENQGKYKLNKDVFSMYDNNCGMKVEGRYKLTFFSRDSVSFSMISDSCSDRSKEVNGGTIMRVK